MRDPYAVLGISPGADTETIKKAYRRLAKENHPDRFANEVQRAAADERMKEINAAYQAILSGDADSGRNDTSGPGARTYADYDNSDDVYQFIQRMIAYGNLRQAEALLMNIQPHKRNAQWHYCLGLVYARRGWLERAAVYFEQAHRMEPENPEYRQMFERVQNGRKRAAASRGGVFWGGKSGLGLCCLANLCCNLLGGGFFCC